MDRPEEFARCNLTTRPNDTDGMNRYRIIRTPANGLLKAICLGIDAVGAYTHYYRGRTRPHTQPDCEACQAGVPTRWLGYLGVLLPKEMEIAILEFPSGCCSVLDEYLRLHRSLRGAEIWSMRAGSRPNARVRIQLRPGSRTEGQLPADPDIRIFLARLWDLHSETLERRIDAPAVDDRPIVLPTRAEDLLVRGGESDSEVNERRRLLEQYAAEESRALRPSTNGVH